MSAVNKILRLNGIAHHTFKSAVIRSVTSNAGSETNDCTASLKSWKKIPGPPTMPILGCAFYFLPGGPLYKASGHKIIEHLYSKFGSIVRLQGIIGIPPLVLLFDPEDMAQVLRSENWMPERPGFQSLEYFRKKHTNTDPENSTGLLSEHGEKWKSFRSTVNPVMLQPKIVKLYSSSLDEVALDMIKRMRSLRDDKNMIKEPLDVEMNKWALESIGVVALGGRIGCLRDDLPTDAPATRLIRCVHEIFRAADELDFKSTLWRFISTSTFKRAMKYYQEQVDLSKYFIQEAMEQINKKKAKDAEEKSVLEKLLEVDERTAVIMASDMLLAGVDTTANTIIATLYLLGSNPDKQAKLREEILAKDERKPYLKACIKESMRLLPISSGNLRRTTKEYNIKGYLIPKGLNVIMNHEFVSKQENQYDRPKEFIPERWMHKSAEAAQSRAHPLATSPFGFGARSCIGRRIAELELETLLTRIVEHFHVEWFGPPLKQETRAITYMVGPYNFIFRDVK